MTSRCSTEGHGTAQKKRGSIVTAGTLPKVFAFTTMGVALLGLASLEGQAQTITEADRAAQHARLEALDIKLEDGGLVTVANGAVQGDDPARSTAAVTATIVFDNMPGDVYNDGIGWDIRVTATHDFDQGDAFIPSITGTLTDVWLAANLLSGPNKLDVWVFSDSAGQPGAIIHTIHFSGEMGQFGLLNPPLHWTGTGPIIFAGTQYWLIASATGPNEFAAWNLNSIGDFGPHAGRTNLGAWAISNNTRGAFRIGVGPVVCGKCETFNPGTGQCEKDPGCCASDAQCGKCETCVLITNTCGHVPGCCTFDEQCPADPKCFDSFCNRITNQCELSAKIPGCCTGDAQCPADPKCFDSFCNTTTNECELSAKFPGCCTGDAQCPEDPKCFDSFCNTITNECEVSAKFPGCCTGDAQCPSEKCRPGFCDIDNTCQLQVKQPGCCTDNAQCPSEIPTTSQWGLVVMSLLLLVGAKVYFGRRQRLPA